MCFLLYCQNLQIYVKKSVYEYMRARCSDGIFNYLCRIMGEGFRERVT